MQMLDQCRWMALVEEKREVKSFVAQVRQLESHPIRLNQSLTIGQVGPVKRSNSASSLTFTLAYWQNDINAVWFRST